MASTFTAVIRQDGPWWIGWIEEVASVSAQEHSLEELLESLRQVLREALEFNRLDALEAAGPGSEELALSL
jgi:predicted RNase H-like HicB family nuclease